MSAADALAALRTELDRLASDGRRIDWWWRDDDAIADGPALGRLLALAGGHGIPLSLAVIPSRVEPSLPDRLAREADVTVLVHGWSHANHAAAGMKRAEFGDDRPTSAMAQEAGAGLDRVASAFGSRSRAVFVPPWNRIGPRLAERLPELGYRGLSCFGAPAFPGRIDTHLDPVDWRGSGSLAGPGAIVAMLRQALARGAGTIGFLTHHLAFDEPLWAFSEGVARICSDHPALRPVGLDALLARTAGQTPARNRVPA